jgi:glycosyltransferase involved in cell wall biosynthesis
MFPKVSICIPVFNGEQTIMRAVNSALNQTYSNLEIIIVDNCSTDNTLDLILNKFQNRIKIIQREKNFGMLNNFLFVVENATGEYTITMGADDELSSDCIDKLVKVILKNNSNAAFCKSLRIENSHQKIIAFQEHNSIKELIRAVCSNEKINYLICGLWEKKVYYETFKKLDPKLAVRGSSSDRLFVFFALFVFGIKYSLSSDILYYKYYQQNIKREGSIHLTANLLSIAQCINMILKTDKKLLLFSQFFPRWFCFQTKSMGKKPFVRIRILFINWLKKRISREKIQQLKKKLQDLNII